MHRLCNGYFKGIYKDGSIHTETFSIRCKNDYKFSQEEKFYGANVLMDELDRPYLTEVFELDKDFLEANSFTESFCFMFLKPDYNGGSIQIVPLDFYHICVDFSAVKEPMKGLYRCTLEYRNHIWTFVVIDCLYSTDS